MRILMLHVDRFISTVTEKGRSKVIEEVNPDSKTTDVDEALLILVSVEKNDESSHESARAQPETALEILKFSEEGLIQHDFEVIRTPFGWFNSLEIKAKGHPLSRVARVISSS